MGHFSLIASNFPLRIRYIHQTDPNSSGTRAKVPYDDDGARMDIPTINIKNPEPLTNDIWFLLFIFMHLMHFPGARACIDGTKIENKIDQRQCGG